MILLCGIPSEPPLAMVQRRLDELGAPYVMFNQRTFLTTKLTFTITDGHSAGRLTVDHATHRLEDFHSVYTRLMDDRLLPELRDEDLASPLRHFCRSLHDALWRWLEVAPGRIVNRPSAMGSNSSKPYQMQLIRTHGFAVPETLVTNNPALVRRFYEEKERVIYKSISGVRSIVQSLEDEDLERLDRIRWCPTLFQEYVEGEDIRVHTIGSTVFATKINSSITDYRYSGREGIEPAITAIDIKPELSVRCVNLSESLGLDFAGIDLKITPENEVFCFEVNPCPAFSYYETSTGQPIAAALAEYLAGTAANS